MIQHISPFEQVHHCALSPSSEFSRADQVIIDKLLNEDPIFFVKDKIFYARNAENCIFAVYIDMSHADAIWASILCGDYINDPSKTVPKSLLFTREEERAAFYQYNFARYRINKLQKLSRTRKRNGSLTVSERRELLRWYKDSDRLHKTIVIANLGLSIAMIKKKVWSDVVHRNDLLAESNMAVARAVEKFNVGFGWKFSTYACKAVLKAIGRAMQKEQKIQGRQVSMDFQEDHTFDYVCTRTPDPGAALADDEARADFRRVIKSNIAGLTNIEREILEGRFPLDPEKKQITLKVMGEMVGLTKERVRQIQNRALMRLKEVVEPFSDRW